VTGVEMFRKLLDEGRAGDNIGPCYVGRSARTWSAASVGKAWVDHAAQELPWRDLHIEEEEAGGTRHFQGYRPQFYFRTTDVTGEVKLPEGTEMVMPGTT